jgi:hypothetical protein
MVSPNDSKVTHYEATGLTMQSAWNREERDRANKWIKDEGRLKHEVNDHTFVFAI